MTTKSSTGDSVGALVVIAGADDPSPDRRELARCRAARRWQVRGNLCERRRGRRGRALRRQDPGAQRQAQQHLRGLRCPRGKKRKARQEAADEKAAEVSKHAAVARSGATATKLYNNSDGDLVDAQAGGAALDDLEEEALPDEMRDMKPAERKAYIKKKADERAKIQEELNKLNKKRTAYVKKEIEKKGSKKDRAFDAALSDALKQQAAEKGIAFE